MQVLLLLFSCSGCSVCATSFSYVVFGIVVGIVAIMAVDLVDGLGFSVGFRYYDLLETVIPNPLNGRGPLIADCVLLFSSSRAFSGTCAAISNNKFWWMQRSRDKVVQDKKKPTHKT